MNRHDLYPVLLQKRAHIVAGHVEALLFLHPEPVRKARFLNLLLFDAGQRAYAVEHLISGHGHGLARGGLFHALHRARQHRIEGRGRRRAGHEAHPSKEVALPGLVVRQSLHVFPPRLHAGRRLSHRILVGGRPAEHIRLVMAGQAEDQVVDLAALFVDARAQFIFQRGAHDIRQGADHAAGLEERRRIAGFIQRGPRVGIEDGRARIPSGGFSGDTIQRHVPFLDAVIGILRYAPHRRIE